MNANELNTDLEGAKLVILRLNDTLLQLKDDFKKMQVSNQSWEIIAKGYGKTIEEQQAEIEALKLSCPKCGGVTGKLEVLNVPAKTLTDFEIRGVMALDECWVGEDCSIPNMIAFARAILKKAEEK